MKYSTAKTVLKIYKKEGRVDKRKTRKKQAVPKLRKEEQKMLIQSKEEPQEKTTSIRPMDSPVLCPQFYFTQTELSWRLPQGFWGAMLTAHMISQSLKTPFMS